MLSAIAKGTNPNHKKQASFLAIYSEAKIWSSYNEINEDEKQIVVPLVLMIDRWDGCKGFIGGIVEKNETLLQAAIRELKEEVGYDLHNEEILSQEFISSYEMDSLVTHLTAIEVSFDKLKQIMSSLNNAEHYLSEVSGISAIQFINYSHKKSFDNFINSVFAPTVKEEIIDLILAKNWNYKYNINIKTIKTNNETTTHIRSR